MEEESEFYPKTRMMIARFACRKISQPTLFVFIHLLDADDSMTDKSRTRSFKKIWPAAMENTTFTVALPRDWGVLNLAWA
jgi:hypothetical protein